MFITGISLRVAAAGHFERIRLLLCWLQDIVKGTQDEMVFLDYACAAQQFGGVLLARGTG